MMPARQSSQLTPALACGVLLLASMGAAALAAGSPPAGAAAPDIPEKVTYAADVAAILGQDCIACHREGDIAPMSLRSYDEVRPWAKSIRKAVVTERSMPPWHASPEYGHFKNDRSLNEREIAIIDRWVKQGAKEGDPSLRPEPPDYSDGWRLGEPDLIVTFDEVSLPGGGPDVFEDLAKAADFEEGKWLRAVEVRPGNRQVVHHVILFASAGEGQPESGWLGAWAAGMEPMVFPEGAAKWVGPGSSLVADMHYHPAAEPATDSTQIGLYFYAGEPEKELINLWVQNSGFKIPAGAKNHEVKASHTFDEDGYIHGLLPHMHYRGKDFVYTATYPDGTKQTLLEVKDYDFNWQTLYNMDEPIEVPKGTRLDCVAHFDNSTDNPDNPDPTVDVTFGNESYDEMMIGFVDYVVKDGLRPMSVEDKMRTRLAVLLDEHPGEIWWMDLSEEGGEGSEGSVMWLPADGSDGMWLLSVNNTLTDMTIGERTENGNNVSATVISPFGALELEGTRNGQTFEGRVKLPFEGADDLLFEGRPATREDAEIRGGKSTATTASR